jgi:hypothetical protein
LRKFIYVYKGECDLDYSKKEKKLLKSLINLAYERELTSELNKLELSFSKFKNNKIDAFEFDNIIHKYHNGVSRNIFKKYNDDFRGGLPDMVVAHSLKNGFLKREEIDESLIERIEDIIKSFYS